MNTVAFKRALGVLALGLLGVLLGAPARAADAPKATGAAPPPAAAAPQYSRKGADTCINCHDGPEILSIFKTKHARRADARTPFGHGNLQCEACHGPGGTHAGRTPSGQKRAPMPAFAKGSTASVSDQNGRCLTCHQGDMKHGWTGSSHERQGLSCASCHDSHAPADKVLATAEQPSVCYTCHQEQRVQTQLPFTHPVRAGKMTCTSCHDAHGTAADANLVRRTVNDTCYTCHAEKRGPFLWEHAPVAEDCSLCHKPHGSSSPGMLNTRAPFMCQQCHSQAGHPSVAVGPGNLNPNQPSAVYALGGSCLSCHSQVHGSNHPSGAKLMR